MNILNALLGNWTGQQPPPPSSANSGGGMFNSVLGGGYTQQGGGIREFLRDAAPMIAMMDPLGRNNAMAAAMMQRNDGRRKDRRNQQTMTDRVSWLKGQGVSESDAAYLASDDTALRQWYAQRTQPNERKTTTIDGRLVDAQTGEVIADFSQPDQTSAQQNFEYLREMGVDPETAMDRAFSGGTTVNVTGQSARDQADAQLLKDMQDSYATALRLQPALSRAKQAIQKAPDGYAGRGAALWGSIAGSVGLEVPEGASEAQLLNSINTQLAGLYRLPGPVSDAEMQLYLQAAPRLGDTKAANLAKIELFERLMERSGRIVGTVRKYAGSEELYDHLAALDTPIFSDEERTQLQAVLSGEQTETPDGWTDFTPGVRIRRMD